MSGGIGWPGSLLICVALTLSGCNGQEMDRQPRYEALEPAALFENNQSARSLPPGTVAQEHFYVARPQLSRALLARGRERFNIYCSPCHSEVGDGTGMIVQRGFPKPPSYHTERLRQLPDQHFYDVITNGYGAMYSYAARVNSHDRWAIVAYIRALQLSQYAEVVDLPPEVSADSLSQMELSN